LRENARKERVWKEQGRGDLEGRRKVIPSSSITTDRVLHCRVSKAFTDGLGRFKGAGHCAVTVGLVASFLALRQFWKKRNSYVPGVVGITKGNVAADPFTKARLTEGSLRPALVG
jgi:hypothetical protein